MIIYFQIIFLLILLILLIIFLKLYPNKLYLRYESFNNIKYTAVIIEPRKHKALKFVLENFAENLSNEWDIIIFHGNTNLEYIIKIIDSSSILSSNKNRIKFINLNVDNLTIRNYNDLLVSKDFYDDIPTEIFLIFQTDTIICKNNKDLINKYIKYDYTGAPWKDKVVGNGGLSIRKKSKMLEIIENCKYSNQPEDIYFSKACPEIYRNQPSFEEAKEFSVETVYNDISFGVHKPWRHLKESNFYKKNDFCEGLEELRDLNNF